MILKAKCNSLKKIKLPWPLCRIFVSVSIYKQNPQVRKTNPGKGVQNLAEEFNFDFIKKNKNVVEIPNTISGKNYKIILNKFILPKYRKYTFSSVLISIWITFMCQIYYFLCLFE